MSDKHVAYPDEEKGHDCVDKKTENGACLKGHEGAYKKRSCSYRWQAHEVSKLERKDVYHNYLDNIKKSHKDDGGIPTMRYETKSGGQAPWYYTSKLNLPEEGHWDLDGPKQSFRRNGIVKVKKGKNFTKDHWPYWHNAHHLIPKALLNNTILNELEENSHLCRGALLSVKYNINHKVNMIILPQDKEVAAILNLPRHLVLKEPGRTPQCTNHAAYTDTVETELLNIINGYKKIVDKAAEENHESPKPELDKIKLETLSKDCYQTILDFGKTSPGEPIDDIPEITG